MGVLPSPAISQSPRGQLYGWLPLSDAAGIIILQFDIPILFHYTMSFLCWALQMPVLDTPGFQIRVNGILSNKHHVLTPKNRGCWSRKSTLVEKTAIFKIFGNLLADRRLHGFLSVNKRFTKYKFAKGKVSLRERPCFAVWKVMFEAMKHNLWRGHPLAFTQRKLRDGGRRN